MVTDHGIPVYNIFRTCALKEFSFTTHLPFGPWTRLFTQLASPGRGRAAGQPRVQGTEPAYAWIASFVIVGEPHNHVLCCLLLPFPEGSDGFGIKITFKGFGMEQWLPAPADFGFNEDGTPVEGADNEALLEKAKEAAEALQKSIMENEGDFAILSKDASNAELTS